MNDKNFHEIFNLGNDNPIKTLDLLNMIKEEYAAAPKIIKNTTDNESFSLTPISQRQKNY